MIEVKDMISVAEAAKRLNRSAEQVRRNLRDGKLKGQRVGNQWFVDEASLKTSAGHEPDFLIPREFIQQVKLLRQQIAERNGGVVFDVVRMIEESREGR